MKSCRIQQRRKVLGLDPEAKGSIEVPELEAEKKIDKDEAPVSFLGSDPSENPATAGLGSHSAQESSPRHRGLRLNPPPSGG